MFSGVCSGLVGTVFLGCVYGIILFADPMY